MVGHMKFLLLLLLAGSPALASYSPTAIIKGATSGNQAEVDGSNQLKVVQASAPLPSGAAQEHTTAGSPSSCRLTDGSSFYDARQVTVQNASLAVTGTFWQATQPVSAASLPLPSGASQEHAFDVDSGAGTQNVQGVSLRKAASGGSVEYGTSSDPLRVDPTGTTTQPVSAASLPLPSGAATSAKQPALGTAGSASADVITIQGIASMTALKVDGSGVTQPVSGPLTDTQLRATAVPISVSGTAAVNISQVGGASASTAASGVQKVGISGATAVTLDSADNAAAPANGLMMNGYYSTTVPALTSGNAAFQRLDSTGAAYSNMEGRKATYSVAAVDFAPISSATAPSFSITGSATKTVKVTRIGVSATAATGGVSTINLRRFSALSGGTSASQSANIAKHVSGSAAATAVVNTWSVAATTATSAGILRSLRFEFPTPAVTVQPILYEWFFGDKNGQAITLSGTSEFLGLCFNGIATTPTAEIYIEWSEE